jgi:hypothetical protein
LASSTTPTMDAHTCRPFTYVPRPATSASASPTRSPGSTFAPTAAAIPNAEPKPAVSAITLTHGRTLRRVAASSQRVPGPGKPKSPIRALLCVMLSRSPTRTPLYVHSPQSRPTGRKKPALTILGGSRGTSGHSQLVGNLAEAHNDAQHGGGGTAAGAHRTTGACRPLFASPSCGPVETHTVPPAAHRVVGATSMHDEPPDTVTATDADSSSAPWTLCVSCLREDANPSNDRCSNTPAGARWNGGR